NPLLSRAGKASEEADGEGKRAPGRARRQGQKGVFCPDRQRLGHSRVVDRTNPPQHTPYESSAAVFALVQSGLPLHRSARMGSVIPTRETGTGAVAAHPVTQTVVPPAKAVRST